MSWIDKKLYWKWVDDGIEAPLPPKKRLEYVDVDYARIHMRICCGVFDDEKYTPLHRDEIEWHERQGAKITWPTPIGKEIVRSRRQALWDRCGPQLQAFIKQGVADRLSFLPPIFDHDSTGERVYVVKY